MADSDWDEIKRLAADFQRAQLSSTVQRLSERNCVEIVQCLLAKNLIDVIYTIDGKEYLTHDELKKEISEEIEINGGRVNLVNVSKALNVDLSHVEIKANEIASADPHIHIVLGQLITSTYEKAIAEEINDNLIEEGKVSVGELITYYDLPRDFVTRLLSDHVGTTIKGQYDTSDKDIIFTETYVNKYRAILRGAMSGLTRPVTMATLMNLLNLHGNIFFSIVDELVKTERIKGSVTGGKQSNAIYVPEIYTRAQTKWVKDFYNQNGYLEYDAMSRLGLTDAKGYIKKNYKGESLTFLSSCCIGNAIIDRVQSEVEEALSTSGWFNIMPSLPSILSELDGNQILQKIVKSFPGATIFCDTIVVSAKFLETSRKSFDKQMAEKAEKDAKENPGLWAPERQKMMQQIDDSSHFDERKDGRKKKGGKGGGTQGREVKTKAVKKKYMKGRNHDDDSDHETASGKGGVQELEFLSAEEIAEHLQKLEEVKDCPDDLVLEISEQLYRPLKKQYQDIARSVFLQTVGAATGSSRKEAHGELQEKLTGLWTNVKLFEKGLKLFPDETAVTLEKYLLKTLCSEMTNLCFKALAKDQMVSIESEKQITPEMRMKILGKISNEKLLKALTNIHNSLNGSSLTDFLEFIDTLCEPQFLGILLKKPDKKKERQLVFAHRQVLLEELRQEIDPALTLHLAAVLLVTINTQTMIHIPGRTVPQVIAILKQFLEADQHDTLVQFEKLIIAKVKNTSEDEAGGDLSREIEELQPKVRELALNFKKSNKTQDN